MERILEKANLFWAAAVMVLSAVFGEFWYLFAAFAALNIVDYITGWIKARCDNTESSDMGLKGILKKLGYWIVIGIAFFTATAFGSFGEYIGIDLGFTVFIGWFTLATFMINEIRSVLENLVEIGVEVPDWLIRGLDVAHRRLTERTGGDDKNK